MSGRHGRGRVRPAEEAAGCDAASPPPPARGSGPATLRRFVGWMLRNDPADAAVVAATGLAEALLPAASVWIVAKAFADALGVYRGTQSPAALLRWLGAWAALLVVQELVSVPSALAQERLRDRMEDSVQAALQRKASALRLEVFERADFYDIVTRARNAASPGFFIGVVAILFSLPSSIATVVALGAVVGRWSPWLVAALLVAAIPSPLVEGAVARSSFFLGRANAPLLRVRTYLEEVLTSRDAAKEVRTYDLAPWLLEWWRSLYWSVADALHAFERRASLPAAGLRSLSAAGLAGGLAVAGWSLVRGGIGAGEFAAMLLALQSLQGAVIGVLDPVRQQFGDSLLRLGDLFVCLDLGPEEPAGGEPVDPAAGLGEIVLDRVSFRYPQGAAPALRDVSLTLRPDERVALVGENGAGKTTLVKVLTGLYRPTAGRVTYGGRDLAALDPAGVRALQAAVFQDHIHYAFTLDRNVGYGRAERMGDRGAVEEAGRQGGADAVAAALPQGYDTLLTGQFTGGTELSGGQWQRVAVSRGVMRQAPLIVLDEPTAALDPRAEADAFRRFAALARGRSALLVSHRLGFARLCDRVVLLRDGCVAEQGTHDELVAGGGEYARMWALQAHWYR